MRWSRFGTCFCINEPAVKQDCRADHGLECSHAEAQGDWQALPEDLRLDILRRLAPADAASARLTCAHWRSVAGRQVGQLSLPMGLLAKKHARRQLRTAVAAFPALHGLRLHHVNGWCDPVQARMDCEPLVSVDTRSVHLEPLAAVLPQLGSLTLTDACFSRRPWNLGHLRRLPGLTSLSFAWDTALWAPGQALQEWEALCGVFGLGQLEQLALAKSAYVFLGELPLGNDTLAGAAGLTNLQSLSLGTIRVNDAGFRVLRLLPQLAHLALRGTLSLSLSAMAEAFGGLTGLTELRLGVVGLTNDDLAAMMLAHRDAAVAGGYRAQGQWQLQQWQLQQQAWQGSGSAAPPGEDWSVVFAPLRRLRKVSLHSPLALLGSCACLRALPSLETVHLQGSARFWCVERGCALPPSWLAPGCGDWAALESLEVDGVQLADGLAPAVAELTNLRTLIVSGPCLLSPHHHHYYPQQQQQQQQQFWQQESSWGHAVGRQQPLPPQEQQQQEQHRQPEGQRQEQQQQQQLTSTITCPLACLSSLCHLQKLHLHSQPGAAPGLRLDGPTLALLAPQWASSLTSLWFELQAPAQTASTQQQQQQQQQQPAVPLRALAQLTALTDLSISLSDSSDASERGSVTSDCGPGSSTGAECGCGSGCGGGASSGCALLDWGCLPPHLASLSLVGWELGPHDVRRAAAAAPRLRHLRLLYCHVCEDTARAVASSWCHLVTLIIREQQPQGLGPGVLAAASRLSKLTALGLTLARGVDVRPLAVLAPSLQYLLLDGRSDVRVAGAKHLAKLRRLRCLVLPLLSLHHEAKGQLAALQAALPGAALYNISNCFGCHGGAQWFAAFGQREREWWRLPEVPWVWYPLLHLTP